MRWIWLLMDSFRPGRGHFKKILRCLIDSILQEVYFSPTSTILQAARNIFSGQQATRNSKGPSGQTGIADAPEVCGSGWIGLVESKDRFVVS